MIKLNKIVNKFKYINFKLLIFYNKPIKKKNAVEFKTFPVIILEFQF